MKKNIKILVDENMDYYIECSEGDVIPLTLGKSMYLHDLMKNNTLIEVFELKPEKNYYIKGRQETCQIIKLSKTQKNELGLDEDLILKTYQDWKRLGYQVKKGEKSVMACMIWFPKKTKVKTEVDYEEVNDGSFFKSKAFFFSQNQVERIA